MLGGDTSGAEVLVCDTVGAQSINRFKKNNVFLPQHISGHRHDRELWFFFCLKDLDHGYHLNLKKCKKV